MRRCRALAAAFDLRSLAVTTLAERPAVERLPVRRRPKYGDEFWVRIRAESLHMSQAEQAKAHDVPARTIRWWRAKAWAQPRP